MSIFLQTRSSDKAIKMSENAVWHVFSKYEQNSFNKLETSIYRTLYDHELKEHT